MKKIIALMLSLLLCLGMLTVLFAREYSMNKMEDELSLVTRGISGVLQQIPSAEELLGTLLYLVDEHSSGFVTGVVIPVDGGFSAYSGV